VWLSGQLPAIHRVEGRAARKEAHTVEDGGIRAKEEDKAAAVDKEEQAGPLPEAAPEAANRAFGVADG
jgi:hypothetical protein